MDSANSYTGYHVTNCFQSAFVEVRKTVENSACFGSNLSRTVCAKITKCYIRIANNRLYKRTGYDITRFFRSAAKCNYILHKCAQMGQSVKEMNMAANIQPRITQFCTNSQVDPAYRHTGYDITTSGRHLWKFDKTVGNSACDGFGSNFWRTV